MAPSVPRVRKRNRKRKRRNVSSSLSSSSSSEDECPRIVPSSSKPPPSTTANVSDSDSDSSLSSSSSSSSAYSSSPSSTRPTQPAKDTRPDPSDQTSRRHPSRSPSPFNTTLPDLFSANPTTDAEKEREKTLKEKFRKFWMSSIANGFKGDLEQIHKEPNMTTSRLSLLIDSLASGADVFSSVAQSGPGNQVNEMEVVLGSHSS